MAEYIIANTPGEYLAAAELFREYAAWLNIDLGFQHFDQELQMLQNMYGPPLGVIILFKDEEYKACIAFRKIGPQIAELKRMYVKPSARKSGVGKELLQQALALAKKNGYKIIRLDTLDTMTPAINLYKSQGFQEIPPYYFNPNENAVFFEKIL